MTQSRANDARRPRLAAIAWLLPAGLVRGLVAAIQARRTRKLLAAIDRAMGTGDAAPQ